MEIPVIGYFLHATTVPQTEENNFKDQLRIWLFTEKGISEFTIPSSDKDEAIVATIPFIPYSISKNRDGLFAHRTSSSKDKRNPLVPICFNRKKNDDRKVWAALDVPSLPDELRDALDAARKKLHVSVFMDRKEMPPTSTMFTLTFEVRFRSQGNPTQTSYLYPGISAVFDKMQAPIIAPASLSFILPDDVLQQLKDNHNIRLGLPGLPNNIFPVITAKQLISHSLLEGTAKDLISFCLEYHENLIKCLESDSPRTSALDLATLKRHRERLQSMHTHSDGCILLHPYHFEGFTKPNAVLLASKFNALPSPISTFLFSPISPLSTSLELARELNPLLYHERLTLHVHYYLKPIILIGVDVASGEFIADGPSAVFALTETRRPLATIVPALLPENSTLASPPEGPAPFYESDQEGRHRRGCYDGFIGLTRSAWAKHPVDKAIRAAGVRMGTGHLPSSSIYQTLYVATARPSTTLSSFLQSGRRFGLFSMTKAEFTTPLAGNPLLCLLRLGAMEGQGGTGRTLKFLLQLGTLEVPLIAGLAPLSASVLKLFLNPLWPNPGDAFGLLKRSLSYFNEHRSSKGLARSFMSLLQGEEEYLLNRRPPRTNLQRGQLDRDQVDSGGANEFDPPSPDRFYYIFANLPFVQDEVLFRLLKSRFPELLEPTWYHSTDPRSLSTYLVAHHPTALPNIKAGFLEVGEFKLRLEVRVSKDLPPAWLKDEPLSQITTDALLCEAHMADVDCDAESSDKEDFPEDWDMPLQWINSRILISDYSARVPSLPPTVPPNQDPPGNLSEASGDSSLRTAQAAGGIRTQTPSSPLKRRIVDCLGAGHATSPSSPSQPLRSNPAHALDNPPDDHRDSGQLDRPPFSPFPVVDQYMTRGIDFPDTEHGLGECTFAASPTFDPEPASAGHLRTPQPTNFFPFHNRAHGGSLFFSSSTPPAAGIQLSFQPTSTFFGRPPLPAIHGASLTPGVDPRVLGATQYSSINAHMDDLGPDFGGECEDDFVPSTQPDQGTHHASSSGTTTLRRSERPRRPTHRFSPSNMSTPMPGPYSEALITGTLEQRQRQEREIAQQAAEHHQASYVRELAQSMARRGYRVPTKRDRVNDPSPTCNHEDWSGSSPTIDSSRSTPPPNFGREGYNRLGLDLYNKVMNIVMESTTTRKITDRLLEGGEDYVVGLLRNSNRLFDELNAVADLLAGEAADREAILQDLHISNTHPGPPLAQPSVASYFKRLPPTPRADSQV